MSAGAALARVARTAVRKLKGVFSQRTAGHVQFDFEKEFYHRFRLTDQGKVEIVVLDLILSEWHATLNIEKARIKWKPGDPPPANGVRKDGRPGWFCGWIKIEDFARIARCDKRAVNDALAGLGAGTQKIQGRGVIAQQANGPGWLPEIEDWPKLSDYKVPRKPAASTDSADSEEEEESELESEETAKQRFEIRYIDPFLVRSSRASRPRKLCDDIDIQFETDRDGMYGSEVSKTKGRYLIKVFESEPAGKSAASPAGYATWIDNYLRDKDWQAAPRGRPRTTAQQERDANREKARQIAAAIDREKGWNR